MQNSSAFQYLALDTIHESTTNPRRTFDEGNPQRESANRLPLFFPKGGDHVSVPLQTQGFRAGEGEMRPAPALQPGAGRTRRNQGRMLHLFLSL
jgi:hypothetical protein